MAQVQPSVRLVRFGVFEVDLANMELRKTGLRVRIQEQPFQVLAMLLVRSGEVVTREELIARLWPDGTFVDFDRGLNAAVARLRQALQDSAEIPRYVETVARRGYRFIAPVEIVSDAALAVTESPVVENGAAVVPRANFVSRRRVWIAITGAVVIAGLAGWLVSQRIKQDPLLEQITRDRGLATNPALSPDGKLLAYASDREAQNLNIWVRQLVPGGSAVRLTHDDWDARQPSFSPDGSRIVYRSERDGGGVDVIPTIGGEPVRLAPGGRDPRFSPDGKWVAYWIGIEDGPEPQADALGATFVIPASGGEPKQLAKELPTAVYPVWSRDSKHLLVYDNNLETGGQGTEWWIVSVDGGDKRRTGLFAALQSQGFSLQFPAALPRVSDLSDDTIIFSAQKGDTRSLWQAPFNIASSRIAGKAERLTQGTTLEAYPSSAGPGLVAFASLAESAAIWSIPMNPDDRKIAGPLQRLTEGETSEATPSISADGRTLVYGSTTPHHEDIWIQNVQTGKKTALASTPAAEWHPVISRDGSLVAYAADDERHHGIFVVSTTGGTPRLAASLAGWIFDWTPDQRSVLFNVNSSSEHTLKRLDVQTAVVSDFIGKPGADLFQTKFSSDGQWLAFEAVIQTGSGGFDSRLYVVKLRNGSPAPGASWIPVGDEHGWSDKPRWSPDGNTLYYISHRDGFRCIWAQRLQPTSKQPLGDPVAIYHFHNRRLSPMNVGLGLLEMDVARDKIVLNLGELTGNVWTLRR